MNNEAGVMRHRVRIEQRSEVRDEIGGVSEQWTLFAEVYAEVKPITGREYLSAQSVQNMVSHRVIIRFLDGIKPSMRIIHRERAFGIVSIRDFFERREKMELMCEEKV